MNVEKLFDDIIVYNNTLSFEKKGEIVDFILDITKSLPIKNLFQKNNY